MEKETEKRTYQEGVRRSRENVWSSEKESMFDTEERW